MKKLFALFLLGGFLFTFSACDNTKQGTEEAGEEVEESIDEAGDELEETGEDIEDEIDGGK